MTGKGSRPRPVDAEKFRSEWERIFDQRVRENHWRLREQQCRAMTEEVNRRTLETLYGSGAKWRDRPPDPPGGMECDVSIEFGLTVERPSA